MSFCPAKSRGQDKILSGESRICWRRQNVREAKKTKSYINDKIQKRQKSKIRGNQRKQVSRLKGPSSKLLKAELHARALLNSGKIEEAIAFLRVKCQRGNSAPTLQSILGVLEVQSGLSQIGLERSKNAAERAPNNFEVLIVFILKI